MSAYRKRGVLLILFIWLFASLSGMHGHYCFDGLEPPVSVHFDALGNHDHDHEDFAKGHKDLDSKPTSMTFLKWLGIHLPFIAAALWLLFIWPAIRVQNFTYFNTPSTWLTVTGLRPPLRAPPASSN